MAWDLISSFYINGIQTINRIVKSNLPWQKLILYLLDLEGGLRQTPEVSLKTKLSLNSTAKACKSGVRTIRISSYLVNVSAKKGSGGIWGVLSDI